MMTKPAPNLATPEFIASEDAKFSDAAGANPVSNDVNHNYSCSATENLGKVQIQGKTTGPVGRFDFVALYDKPVPSDPNSGYLDYFYVSNATSKQTSSSFGSGFYVAYVAYNYATGKYQTVVSAGPT
jgi:hypothetical protein